jgi:hypothetical protein
MSEYVNIAKAITGSAEVNLYEVPVGNEFIITEIQINRSAPAGTTDPGSFWMYHRALAPLGTTSFGDGPVLLRQSVPNTPDIPSAAPAPKVGVSNNNEIYGAAEPSTAPLSTITFGPVTVGGGRSLNFIPDPGGKWSYEVRVYGLLTLAA